jgi:hypothetical protein
MDAAPCVALLVGPTAGATVCPRAGVAAAAANATSKRKSRRCTFMPTSLSWFAHPHRVWAPSRILCQKPERRTSKPRAVEMLIRPPIYPPIIAPHFATLHAGYACPNLCYRSIMKRNVAIANLKEHEAELKQLGVEHLYLFGSMARDEARDGSDVDLLFDHSEGSLGLFELTDIKEAAERILGRKTDIMTRRSLHRILRPKIEASAQQVF